MKSTLRSLAVLVPIIAAGHMAPLQAQVAQDTPVVATVTENAQERINYSGKLRMLSQHIPAAACHLSRGISPDRAAAFLSGATTEFDRILAALEFGDEDLNIIAPETRRKSLARLHELKGTWEPFEVAARAIANGTGTDADLNYLLSENLAVLTATQLVVEELVRQYANPNAVTQASLMLIDISVRQGMLTQKMSKEACMIGTVHETPQTRDELAGTVQVFEASLEALRFGMPQVGILPPLNPEISEGLEVALADWISVKPLMTEVLAGGELDGDGQTSKFIGLNTTMASMNAVVDLYSGATRPNS